jgi:hypothetical protein
MESGYQSWYYERQAEKAIKNLRRNCFEAKYMPDAKAALDEIMGRLKKDLCIGMGDSLTFVQEALDRVKKIAAPINAYKHDYAPPYRPPCSDTGMCSDCRPPARMCCNTVIIEGCSRDPERICVLIIGESLGY